MLLNFKSATCNITEAILLLRPPMGESCSRPRPAAAHIRYSLKKNKKNPTQYEWTLSLTLVFFLIQYQVNQACPPLTVLSCGISPQWSNVCVWQRCILAHLYGSVYTVRITGEYRSSSCQLVGSRSCKWSSNFLLCLKKKIHVIAKLVQIGIDLKMDIGIGSIGIWVSNCATRPRTFKWCKATLVATAPPWIPLQALHSSHSLWSTLVLL